VNCCLTVVPNRTRTRIHTIKRCCLFWQESMFVIFHHFKTAYLMRYWPTHPQVGGKILKSSSKRWTCYLIIYDFRSMLAKFVSQCCSSANCTWRFLAARRFITNTHENKAADNSFKSHSQLNCDRVYKTGLDAGIVLSLCCYARMPRNRSAFIAFLGEWTFLLQSWPWVI